MKLQHISTYTSSCAVIRYAQESTRKGGMATRGCSTMTPCMGTACSSLQVAPCMTAGEPCSVLPGLLETVFGGKNRHKKNTLLKIFVVRVITNVTGLCFFTISTLPHLQQHTPKIRPPCACEQLQNTVRETITFEIVFQQPWRQVSLYSAPSVWGLGRTSTNEAS